MDKITLLFEQLLEMSFTASIVIAAVLLVRCLLFRFPKKYSYCLWSVVLFRLVCPVSVASTFSIFNLFRYPVRHLFLMGNFLQSSSSIILPDEEVSVTAIPGTDTSEAVEYITRSYIPIEATTPTWLPIAALFWLGGMAVILTYSIYCYWKLCKRVEKATLLQGNVYECEQIASPFVLGIFSPKIYIPYRTKEKERDYILSHERYHIRRLDHVIRIIAFFVLTLHWFNPLVWISYYLMCKDMEMSCDEKVLSRLGEEIKQDYSRLLLSFSTGKRVNFGGPLAFGESDTGKRVKNVLRFHPPRMYARIIGIVLLLAVILGCATDENGVRAASFSAAGNSSGSNSIAEEIDYYINEVPGTDSSRTGSVPGTDSDTESQYILFHEDITEVEVTTPQIDLNAPTGADGCSVYYMDENRIIFGGYFGLFVYSIEEEKLIRSVDVKAIGCDATQGDNYCEVLVSADGSWVYLHPINMEKMYVYNIANNALTLEPYDLTDIILCEDFSGQRQAPIGFSLTGLYSTLGEIGYIDENGQEHKLLVPSSP